ncbi:MAG: twin-arginine translocase subunit TatC, partial [Candidatus Omnitrophica bacterium]|nr:twin-arginine translocase subunit TatC [Candidatus Omnitrophota bacterium]
IILSLPVIFTQLWQFASPGLYPNEKRIVTILIGSSTILFLIGVLFAYFVAVPLGLRFFLNFKSSALTPLISLDSYFSFLISFLIAFGIMFDLPVLLIGLIWLGVVKTEFLARQRKLIIIFLFILAAILTPTADVVTQCLLAIPLWLLFELSLWVGYGLEARTGK